MQGSSIWFDCDPVAAVESKMQGSRTEFAIDCTHVAAEESKLGSTMLLRSKMQRSKWLDCDPLAGEESKMQGSTTVIDCAPVTTEESKPGSNLPYRASKEFELSKVHLFPADTPYSKRRKPMTDEEKKKSWQHLCLLHSQAAIAHYNANNPGAEIELVEAGCPRYLIHELAMWFHFNFKARPQNSDSPDPSPKLYFAEILPGEKEHHFTTVCVVDPLDSESIINGCTYCSPDPIKCRIYHPKDGEWTAGRPKQPLKLPDYSPWGSKMQRSKWLDCDPFSGEESELQGPTTVIDCAPVTPEESKSGSNLHYRASKEFELGKVHLFPADTPYSKRRKPMTDEEKKESWQHLCLQHSQAAIAHYNANNPGAEIELVEAGCPRYLIHELAMWFHFNFKARPKNSDSPDPSPRLYFAEILPGEKEHHFTTVCVVDPLNSESIINGCTYCSPDPIKCRIYHPKDGEWTAGRPKQPLRLPDYSPWGSKMQRSKWLDCDPFSGEESELQGPTTVIDCAPVTPEESKSGSNLHYRASKEFELRKVHLFPADTPYSKRRKPMTDEEKKESWQHLCLQHSQAAIAHYNANNPGAEIELVEAGCPRYLIHELAMWFHFNFKARPKNSDSPDPSPRLYFAEILPGEKEHHFTTVCVVDLLDSESIINGCTYCSPDPIKCRIYHPKDGEWTAGRPKQPLRLPDYSPWGSKMQRSKWLDCDPFAGEESELQGPATVIDCAPVTPEESKSGSNLHYRVNSVGPDPRTFLTPMASKEFELGKVHLFPADTPYSKRRKPMTDEEKKESWQHLCLQHSQAAIAHYNANNPGAEIELVEAGCPRYLIHELAMWFHFNFKARPKNSDSPDPSPRLYFAEILPGEKEHHFTTVCVVDPLNSESIINGCTYCSPDPIKCRIYHPKDGEWTAGRPKQPLRLPDYSPWGTKMQRSKWLDCDPFAGEESEMQGSTTMIDCAPVPPSNPNPDPLDFGSTINGCGLWRL